MSDSIPVGISACLPEENDRFDGGHKRLAFAVNELTPWVRFETVRPEAAMEQFSAERIAELEHLCGYIVCEKPPDDGVEQVRIHEPAENNNFNGATESFTAELKRQMPWLPVKEDSRLHDEAIRENFVERIYTLFELNNLREKRLTRGGLIGFHSRYKLLLLAHSQPQYLKLGRFVADIENWHSLDAFFIAYRQRLMVLLEHQATRRNHTNVLMHVQGYFRRQLSSRQRQELTGLIDRYRQGTQPLLAPIALLKHYMAEYPDQYLAQQRYFEPYPEALRLRYGN